jgi:hypothetical protein
MSSGEVLHKLLAKLTDAIPFMLLYKSEQEMMLWSPESKKKCMDGDNLIYIKYTSYVIIFKSM